MAPKSSRKGKGVQKLPFNDDAIQPLVSSAWLVSVDRKLIKPSRAYSLSIVPAAC